jgi:hypothetical protein
LIQAMPQARILHLDQGQLQGEEHAVSTSGI